MICPSCAVDADITPQMGDLAICPGCCRTLVINGDSARLAVKEDVVPLPFADRMELVKRRGEARRRKRR